MPKNKSCATRARGKTRPHSSRYAPVRIPAFATLHMLSLGVASCRNIAMSRKLFQDGVRLALTVFPLYSAASRAKCARRWQFGQAPATHLGSSGPPSVRRRMWCGSKYGCPWEAKRMASQRLFAATVENCHIVSTFSNAACICGSHSPWPG
jgi:hypothetical protein